MKRSNVRRGRRKKKKIATTLILSRGGAEREKGKTDRVGLKGSECECECECE